MAVVWRLIGNTAAGWRLIGNTADGWRVLVGLVEGNVGLRRSRNQNGLPRRCLCLYGRQFVLQLSIPAAGLVNQVWDLTYKATQ